MTKINLNADLGESFGAWRMGNDAELLPLLDSANIACGFHAGDPMVMRQTLRLAKQHGVSIGAHPSFPDLQGFGRRRINFSGDEIQAIILYQIGALSGLAAAEGCVVSHVKPHGALSNMACEDRRLADQVAAAVRDFDRELILLAPALSPLAEAGRQAGLRVVDEIFADRAYLDDGQLMPRSRTGAVIHDPDQACAHVAAMLTAGGLVSETGKILPTPIGSICVHGDGPEAIATAGRLRQKLSLSHELVTLPGIFAQ
jgi:UPF0271 protein